MWFLLIGVAIFGWKWYELGPIYDWSWDNEWWVAVPFVLAVAWWAWADWSGYTKRKAMERESEKKDARIEKQRENLRSGRR